MASVTHAQRDDPFIQQEDEMQRSVNFILGACPNLRQEVVQGLMETYGNPEEAIVVALDLSVEALVHNERLHSRSGSSSTQSPPQSLHSPLSIPTNEQKNEGDDGGDEDSMSKELNDPNKRMMAKRLIKEFPELLQDDIIKAVNCSQDVHHAADKLFGEANTEMKDEPEVLIKPENGGGSGLHLMDGVESSHWPIKPEKSEKSEASGLDLMDGVEASAEPQKLLNLPAIISGTLDTPILTPIPASQTTSFPNSDRFRRVDRSTQLVTIHTGSTNNFSLKSSIEANDQMDIFNWPGRFSLTENNLPKELVLPAHETAHEPVHEPSQPDFVTAPPKAAPTTKNTPIRLPRTPKSLDQRSGSSGVISRVDSDISSSTIPLGTPDSTLQRSRSARDTRNTSDSNDEQDDEDDHENDGEDDDSDEKRSISGDSDSGFSSTDENINIAKLLSLVPGAHYNDCKNELFFADGNLNEAWAALEGNPEFSSEDRSHSRSEIMKGSLDEQYPGRFGKKVPKEVVKNKQPVSNKRAGKDFPEDTPPPAKKRFRMDRNGNKNKKISSTDKKGVEKHFENGTIRVILDSGEHPSKFTKTSLNKITALRDELRGIDETNPAASIKISGVERHVFTSTIHYMETKRIKLDAEHSQTRDAELLTLVKIIIFGNEMRLDLGLHEASSRVLGAAKKILIADFNNLHYEHIQLAYSKLVPGHQLRTLLVHAAYKAEMEFRYLPIDDPDALDSESELETEHMDAAHQAAFQRNRPPFYKELDGPDAIPEFRDEFLSYMRRSWSRRQVPTKLPRKRNGSEPVIDLAKETTLIDPLTDRPFVV